MKKTVFALAALSISASAMAVTNPTANVVWSGFVPGSVAGENLIITGLAGQAIQNGQLIVATDGTFTSTAVTLEARNYDEATQVTGELADATWTLSNAQVSYSSGASTAAKLVVSESGTAWQVGTELADAKKTLNLTVAQEQALPATAGGSVQAQVTLVAEKV
ncbi:TPA: hypothetical protein RQN15_000329 [Aeromonas hydrophila]|nr:hypothetical protein [Aeromonas hydrophila]